MVSYTTENQLIFWEFIEPKLIKIIKNMKGNLDYSSVNPYQNILYNSGISRDFYH